MAEKKTLINDDLIPLEFYLGQNYPNPALESTSIKYCIPYKSVVQIRIFNEDGDELDILLNEEKNPGTFELMINTRSYGNGNYFYLFSTEHYSKLKKMTVLKNK